MNTLDKLRLYPLMFRRMMKMYVILVVLLSLAAASVLPCPSAYAEELAVGSVADKAIEKGLKKHVNAAKCCCHEIADRSVWQNTEPKGRSINTVCIITSQYLSTPHVVGPLLEPPSYV